ncbi:ROK family transcriptional regulator [Clostridium sp. D33t1_170424_F3]|uniref:ROK family transcriptional regulator n=1 Tax=Clostridium sp. D33t1_170424_F3 TaxID=2787099 RepID=UPI0018A9472C|nr:ROK family transcriptional regulator [Clostridium sp. D33t1_170424_F3]
MEKTGGMNNQNLKYRNRGLLLKLICTHEGLSRVHLAQDTGLTKMAVTNIIAELIDQGYVVESTPSRNTGVGRNPITLEISPDAPKVLGIQISREGCTAVLFDLKLRIQMKRFIPFLQEDMASIQNKLFWVVDQISEQEPNILGCGVSVVGPLDVEDGMVLNPPNFFGVSNWPLRQALSEHTGLEVFLNNDMNCAALGEKMFGAGREFHNFLYVGLSVGIGSGIIENDGLYQNSSGFAGELGHTSIDCEGLPCGCGNRGCLEEYIGMPIVLGRLRAVTGWDYSFPQFCDRAGDPRVDAVLTDMLGKLAHALVNAVNLLNPQAILIGHNGVYLPERYLVFLEEEINQRKFSQEYLKVRVRKSRFGVDSSLYGSGCVLLKHLFENGKVEQNTYVRVNPL